MESLDVFEHITPGCIERLTVYPIDPFALEYAKEPIVFQEVV
ncbi:hypothetical protein CSC41_5723 [Pseudomonas aeruginosa]|nr:hypothetical protein CSC41_5723 [Pseudomonas aeruginosa]